MRLLNRKNQMQRLLETVNHSLDLPTTLPSRPPGKAMKAGLIAAGGLAGLTAGSAGISSLRRKQEGASNGS